MPNCSTLHSRILFCECRWWKSILFSMQSNRTKQISWILSGNHDGNETFSCGSNVLPNHGLLCRGAAQSNVRIQSTKFVFHSHTGGNVYSDSRPYHIERKFSCRIFGRVLRVAHNHRSVNLFCGDLLSHGEYSTFDWKIWKIHWKPWVDQISQFGDKKLRKIALQLLNLNFEFF